MKRALVVIDVQESFRQLPNWPLVSDPEIATKVAMLTDAFRASNDLVVWVFHAEPGSGTPFDPQSGFVRPISGLLIGEGEPVLTKTSHNAFTTTNLHQLLTQRGVGEVTLCGIRTEQCVETTARLAADFGFQVVVVIDATATHPIEHRDAARGRTAEEILADPRTLTTDEVIRRTEYALSGRFAAIRTMVDELVAG